MGDVNNFDLDLGNLKDFAYIEFRSDTKEMKGHNTIIDIKNVDTAGVVIDTDFVVLDFDGIGDVNKIEKLISSGLIEPTLTIKSNKGFHLYYKKPFMLETVNKMVNIGLTCGLRCDFLATNNNNKIITAKIKNLYKFRQRVDTTGIMSKNELPELPLYFYPLMRSKEYDLDLLNIGVGQRNDSLFRQQGFIKGNYPNFEPSELATILEFINNNILTDGIDVKELSSIVKSGVTSAERSSIKSGVLGEDGALKYYNDKGTLLLNVLIQDIIQNFNLVDYGNILFMKPKFLQEYYTKTDNELEIARYINKFMVIDLDETQCKKILFALRTYATIIDLKGALPIRTRNNFELRGENMDFIQCYDINFTMYNLDVDYNPDAYDETVDNFINHIASYKEDTRLLLEEMLGHCLFTNKMPTYSYFLVSNAGKTGKSTFTNMIREFITPELTSTLSLNSLDVPNNIATLNGKLANVGDDIEGNFLELSNTFKSIVSGNAISGRELYEKTKTYKIIATLIFTANKMPRFKDVTGGIERRVVIIPCKTKIKGAIDIYLEDKLSTDNAKSYLLNLAIKGRKRLLENNNLLTYSEDVYNETDNYLNINNSVRSFVNFYDEKGEVLNIVISKKHNSLSNSKNECEYNVIAPRDLYEKYISHCNDGGFTPLNFMSFIERMREVYNLYTQKQGYNFKLFNIESTPNNDSENNQKIGIEWEKWKQEKEEELKNTPKPKYIDFS